MKKVYNVRIDHEDDQGYSENMDSFNILSESFSEAFEEAKKRLVERDVKEDVIGKINLECIIDD